MLRYPYFRSFTKKEYLKKCIPISLFLQRFESPINFKDDKLKKEFYQYVNYLNFESVFKLE